MISFQLTETRKLDSLNHLPAPLKNGVIPRNFRDVGDPGLIRCYEVTISDLSRLSSSIIVSATPQIALRNENLYRSLVRASHELDRS